MYESFLLHYAEAPCLAHYLTLQGEYYQGHIFWHPKRFLVIDQWILITPSEAGCYWYHDRRYRLDYDGENQLRLAIAIEQEGDER